MYLITTYIQESRRKIKTGEKGKLFLKIIESVDAGERKLRTARLIKTDIKLSSIDDIEPYRTEVLRYVKVIYSVIEKLSEQDSSFTIDDVVSNSYKALNEDQSMRDVIDWSKSEFPIRTDIATVGNIFKGDFNFVYATKQPDNPDSLLDYVFNKAQQLKTEGRDSFSRSYKSTRASIEKYLNGRGIAIGNVDRTFLENYSQWLKDNGVADSTQSFYLRTLRSVMKAAKDEGLVNYEDNLFLGLNTRILFEKEEKQNGHIDKNVILRIEKLKLEKNSDMALARDIFMFAFYCRGMELVDVVNLTKNDIRDGKLTYNRRSKGLPRTVPLDHNALAIIERYKNCSSTHLFPIKEDNKGLSTHAINRKVWMSLSAIGTEIGYDGLSFNKNIEAWEYLISQANVADLLLGKKQT